MTEVQPIYMDFWQQPAVLGLPSLVFFLFLLGTKPRDKTWAFALVFSLVSAADAYFTAKDRQWTGFAATVVPIFFVVMGDFRVYLWTMKKLVPALGVSLVVPVVSWLVGKVVPADWASNLRIVFLTYELLFLVTFAFVTVVTVGSRGFRDPVRLYTFLYYGLWSVADASILATGGSQDASWMLRIAANLLYYVGYVPWVYLQARRAEGPLGGQAVDGDDAANILNIIR